MLYSTSGQWIRDKRWFTDDDGDGISGLKIRFEFGLQFRVFNGLGY